MKSFVIIRICQDQHHNLSLTKGMRYFFVLRSIFSIFNMCTYVLCTVYVLTTYSYALLQESVLVKVQNNIVWLLYRYKNLPTKIFRRSLWRNTNNKFHRGMEDGRWKRIQTNTNNYRWRTPIKLLGKIESNYRYYNRYHLNCGGHWLLPLLNAWRVTEWPQLRLRLTLENTCLSLVPCTSCTLSA